ncbi:3-keto-5-aminohexanoate cleavage protein [Azospirillum sp. ST 5-10]|uniref:3-keto-5-aminohexanoate cleavage protein n=1 Tax=unclassified Azospirillum TaxID=2630922 RepID=UPI003F49D934
MQSRVIITCAVTGNLTTPDMTPHLPITPGQIAESCLEAAEAGAAAVHIHVRDPETGRPSMDLDHYRDVVERIRTRNRHVIINLTTGPGGRFVPHPDDPKLAGPGTTLMRPEDRVRHIALLKPDVATLDLNTMNSGGQVVINTPDSVRRMAAVINSAGVKPEIELFDSGDIALCRDLVGEGTLRGPLLCSIVMGVKYGFQPSPETVLYARGALPAGAHWTAFGIGRMAFPMVAQSYLAGGHVRIGMEDAVHLEKGVLAGSNAAMVEKARGIVESLGGQIATAPQARDLLALPL